MPGKHPIKLDEYGISRARYYELLSFCRQYEEKKEKLRALRGLSAVQNDGMPHGHDPGDPTGKKALRALQLRDDIEIVEKCVEACVVEAAREALLANVTRGTAPEMYSIPYSRRQFYELRRRFFFLLDQEKQT